MDVPGMDGGRLDDIADELMTMVVNQDEKVNRLESTLASRAQAMARITEMVEALKAQMQAHLDDKAVHKGKVEQPQHDHRQDVPGSVAQRPVEPQTWMQKYPALGSAQGEQPPTHAMPGGLLQDGPSVVNGMLDPSS